MAYVYVPNTAALGHAYFKRYFFPQADKEAIIVDERFNGGGQVADYYIDHLRRPFTAMWATRYGEDLQDAGRRHPRAEGDADRRDGRLRRRPVAVDVPQVQARPAGRQAHLGRPGRHPRLPGADGRRPRDGAELAIWTEDGCVVENDGVPPDVEVEQWPADVIAGKDPQLEKAIEIALKELEKAQRKILRDYTLAITDDPARARDYVPETRNVVTDSVHDAQLAAGTLLQGLPVALKTGYNHVEYAQTLLVAMQGVIEKITNRAAWRHPDQIAGLVNMASHIQQHIAIIAQDKDSKSTVKQLGDVLGKLMNEVKGFSQHLQEQAQKSQQNGKGGLDPKDAAKIQATMLTAQTKQKIQSQAQAQRAAQRQLQFDREMQQRDQDHRQNLKMKHEEAAIDLAKDRVKHLRSLSE